MNPEKAKYIHNLLDTENDHLKKLHEIVCQAVEQEKLLLEKNRAAFKGKAEHGPAHC